MSDALHITANGLLPGQKGTIFEVLEGEAMDRLLEMGLLPGTEVELFTQAPGKGAMAFIVNHTLLALRPQEAALLLLIPHEV